MSASPEPRAERCCAVVELRQYTLHAGRRDTLIELFDREFVDTQEALGISVLGQFRDLDGADRFVWLRGFADMTARRSALTAFYAGPVWQQHRDAANATMIDSDDVLLLKPAFAGSGIAFDAGRRASIDATAADRGIVAVTIRYFDAAPGAAVIAHFRDAIAPSLECAGGELLGSFVTEAAINDYPRLPVRAGEHVLIWLARFDDAAAHARYRALQDAKSADSAQPLLREETLRLAPTTRSQLPWAR